MTHEEFKLYVYNQYDCLHGVFKNLPDKCYEIINDRQKSAHTNRGYIHGMNITTKLSGKSNKSASV